MLTAINANTITAANGDDALIAVQGGNDTAVFAYVENGSTVNNVEASELSLVAVVDNASLATTDFTTA